MKCFSGSVYRCTVFIVTMMYLTMIESAGMSVSATTHRPLFGLSSILGTVSEEVGFRVPGQLLEGLRRVARRA